MMTRSQKHCAVKAWGLRLAAKRGHKRALVAVARKLAVIVHRMWLDGSEFRFTASDQRAGKGVQSRAGGARLRVMGRSGDRRLGTDVTTG